jgi:single-strand DNA-binding protein
MNLAILVGRLAHTPEIKALPSGNHVANASLATNYFYKDKAGENQEGTDWHNLVAYGKTADTMAKWLKGGDQIIVHGAIKTRTWDGEDGKKRYKTEILVERFEFGAKNMKRDDRQNQEHDDGLSEDTKKSDQSDGIDYPTEEINPDNIPF